MADSLKSFEERVASYKRGDKIDDPLQSVTQVLTYWLRAFNGRADLASIPSSKDSGFENRLENLRTSLALGNIQAARELLHAMTPTNPYERGEYLLELTRVEILSGQNESAIKVSDEALQLDSLEPWTRMTLLQVRGHAFINLENYDSAIEELKKAVHFAHIFPFASSSIAARAFLVVAYSKVRAFDLAEKELQMLYAAIEGLDKNGMWLDRLLKTIRADSILATALSLKTEAFQRLMEAKAISDWLDDAVILKKCENDLKNLGDVGTKSEGVEVYFFKGWAYLARFNLLLFQFPKTMSVLPHSPVTHRMIKLLHNRSLSVEEFFENVWDLKFNKSRHDLHVRQALSKLRKIVPKGALIVENRRIFLR